MSLTQVLLVVGLVFLIGVFAYRRAAGQGRAGVRTRSLVDGIDVSGQVSPEDLFGLKEKGYRTIIKMLPDAEGSAQATSSEMARGTAEAGLGYAYVPTSAANMPDTVIDDLGRALAGAERPVLIYCRSGTRAARAWGLAEASRSGGLAREDIVAAVARSGSSAGDLVSRIDARLAAR